MFLENVFPPIPSELIMPLGGFAASRGDLSFLGVCLAGALGSVLGQLPLYYLGHAMGEERLKSFFGKHQWMMVDAEDIERSIGWFERRGAIAVLLCRFVPGVRSLISIPAGIQGMPLVPFLAYSALGMGIWATALAWAGRLLGSNYDKVSNFVGPVSYVVLGMIGVVLVIWVVRKRRASKG